MQPACDDCMRRVDIWRFSSPFVGQKRDVNRIQRQYDAPSFILITKHTASTDDVIPNGILLLTVFASLKSTSVFLHVAMLAYCSGNHYWINWSNVKERVRVRNNLITTGFHQLSQQRHAMLRFFFLVNVYSNCEHSLRMIKFQNNGIRACGRWWVDSLKKYKALIIVVIEAAHRSFRVDIINPLKGGRRATSAHIHHIAKCLREEIARRDRRIVTECKVVPVRILSLFKCSRPHEPI